MFRANRTRPESCTDWTKGLRTKLPDRAPVVGAWCAIRSGVERCRQWFSTAELGQPRESGEGPRRDGGWYGQTGRSPDQGSEIARTAGRYHRFLGDRIRTDAHAARVPRAGIIIHLRLRYGWRAAALRAASVTAPATNGRIKWRRSPLTAMTWTQRCCVCWASTTLS